MSAGATFETSGKPGVYVYCVASTDVDGSGTDGYICNESDRVKSLVAVIDPSWAYDQESTYRVTPLLDIDDQAKQGLTLYKWAVDYVGGDPATELDADLLCDTDYNPSGATVMDVLDTTAGTSSASSGFDSSTCANGSMLLLRYGADPTDANVLIHLRIWYYD